MAAYDYRDFDTQSYVSSSYAGDYDTHASHVTSCEEAAYYRLPKKAYFGLGSANYRNNNASTNLSSHRMMDNQIIGSSSAGGYDAYAVAYGGDYTSWGYQNQVNRLCAKLELAKEMGLDSDSRYGRALIRAGEGLNVDMRMFNGF